MISLVPVKLGYVVLIADGVESAMAGLAEFRAMDMILASLDPHRRK